MKKLLSDKQADEVASDAVYIRKMQRGSKRLPRITKTFSLPSRAKQSFAEECDINNIMSKFNKTGILEHENKRTPQYGDLMPFDDYHAALNQTIEAQDAFDALPSDLRSRFNNEPGEFLKFVDNPENTEEMVELGLSEAPTGPSASTPDAPSGGPDQTTQAAPQASPDPLPTGDSQ